MEPRKSIQVFGAALCLILLISEISSLPYYTPEDYEQGIREVLDEIERQGGLTSAMVPRSYRPNPNHRMMRKSQRSNSLRLRFGKRSVDDPTSKNGAGEWLDDTVQFRQRK